MIGRPKSYSEMLWRIFWCTLGTGVLCTTWLALVSPDVRNFVASIPQEVDLLGGTFPALVVLVPFLAALVSRILLLHDKISDVLGLRRRFDVRHVLVPIARGVNLRVTERTLKALRRDRDQLMGSVFYRYAQTVDKAVINGELVAAALDAWGWFWSMLEPAAILLMAAVIAVFLGVGWTAAVFVVVASLMVTTSVLLWGRCVRAAEVEIREILADENRRREIRENLSALPC